MTSKKRLIDAGDLWSDIMTLPHNGDMISSEEVEQAIMEATTVDAVEVVRCKDCQYFRIDPDDFLGICKCGSIATSYAGEIYPEREHFCSYGERRKEDGRK